MDYYSIARGTPLDASGTKTLQSPQKHSFHCLLDVSSCVNGPFEILLPPLEDDGNVYRRGYRVDDEGKAQLINVGRAVGDDKDCSTCSASDGAQKRGFYALVNGTVVALAEGDVPPTIAVTGVEAAIGPDGGATAAVFSSLAVITLCFLSVVSLLW